MTPMKPMEPMKPMKPMSSNTGWWPDELGNPSSSGGQNDLSYAYFPDHDRIAVKEGKDVTIFDAKGLNVSGFGQQQSNGVQGLTINTNKGQIAVSSLPKVG